MDYEQIAHEDPASSWLESDCMSDMYDDEETKYQVEDYYDDLSEGLPLDVSYDF